MEFCCLFSRHCLNRILSRSLVVGAVTLSLCGLAPELGHLSNSLVFISVAYAQDLGEQEVTNYARTVLQMEPIRQKAFNDIKQIIGREPPTIVCSKPESMNALTGDPRKIAQAYCEQSKAIAQQNGFSVDRFNAITVQVQSDPNLKKRVQDELVRLQTSS